MYEPQSGNLISRRPERENEGDEEAIKSPELIVWISSPFDQEDKEDSTTMEKLYKLLLESWGHLVLFMAGVCESVEILLRIVCGWIEGQILSP